ncbi:MAG: hypothetical protein WC799_25405 [Desulfobacteraceae bacterium]|jgi:hypothetical protein
MKTDSEIKILGFEILNRHLGLVETEKFIALIQRERLDYTKWRTTLLEGMTGKQISQKAMEFKTKKQ